MRRRQECLRHGDWNNDGKPDLLVGNIHSDANKAGGNVWLFLAK